MYSFLHMYFLPHSLLTFSCFNTRAADFKRPVVALTLVDQRPMNSRIKGKRQVYLIKSGTAVTLLIKKEYKKNVYTCI